MIEKYRNTFVEVIALAKERRASEAKGIYDARLLTYLSVLPDDTVQVIMAAMYLGREYIYYPQESEVSPDEAVKEWRKYIGYDEYAIEVIASKITLDEYLEKAMNVLRIA